jgi:bacteriorhodopsin
LIFAIALAFNLNAAAWSAHASKCKLNLQVAFISAVAVWTHYEMWKCRDWYVVYGGAVHAASGTVSFSGLRQLEWMFTTPVLLLVVQNLHAYAFAAPPRKDKTAQEKEIESSRKSSKDKRISKELTGYQPANRQLLIAVDLLMLLCGLVMPLTAGFERVFFLGISMASFFYVIGHSVSALSIF